MTFERLTWRTGSLILALGLLAACSEDARGTVVGLGDDDGGTGDGDGDIGDGDGDDEVGDGDGDGDGPSGLGCNKIDFVFVVDDSGSMEEEQTLLTQSFPKMIAVLDEYKGGSLDYRIAVTASGFPLTGAPVEGEQGMFRRVDGSDKYWLESSNPELSAAFTKLATVGTDGSGQEQTLRSALYSVSEREKDGTNKDFRRSDSLLAVVVITDEDDGSVQSLPSFPFFSDLPVTEIIKGFDAVTGDRSRWASAVIAGKTNCESALGEANEAIRLQQFVTEAGKNATFSDICSGNLEGALTNALDKFKLACDDIVLL